MAKVIVVGASIAGLAISIRLARAGHEVVLLERAARPERTNEPVLLTMPAALRDLFHTTGRPMERVLDLDPVTDARHVTLPDGRSVAVPGVGRAAASAAITDALGPGAARDWDAVIAAGRTAWDEHRPHVESGQSPESRAVVRRFGRSGKSAVDHTVLRRWASAHVADPAVRRLVDLIALDRGADPRVASAELTIWPYLEQAFGVWDIRGGTESLRSALRDRAAQRGVQLCYDREVAALVSHDERATGVRLKTGAELAADVVVAAVDPRLVVPWLAPGSGATAYARALARLPTSASDVRLLLPPLVTNTQRTVLLGADADRELDALRRGRLPAPDDMTITVTASAIGTLVQAPVPPHDPTKRAGLDWTSGSLATGVTGAVIRRTAHLLDGATDAVLRTPADHERERGTPGGSRWGPAPAPPAFTARVPQSSFLPGFALVGTASGPGGDLPLRVLAAAWALDAVTASVG